MDLVITHVPAGWLKRVEDAVTVCMNPCSEK
jgi:hypothetical protein